MRTRVGYAGGDSDDPTYFDLGDHGEALQIDFDPQRMSFGEVLDLYFAGHRPTRPPWKRQYMSALFFHDGEQRRLIEQRCRQAEEQWGEALHVEILSADSFHRAEDHHQKYYLQRHSELMDDLTVFYPDFAQIVDSTAAARLNGFLAGARTHVLQNEDLARYGLSERGQRILRRQARGGRG